MTIYLHSKVRNIHCIGIAGAGMSAIAEILHKKGYGVSGSDRVQNNMTHYLKKMNIDITFDHQVSHALLNADLIVYSSAISQEHPALRIAKKQGIPAIARGRMLSALLKEQYTIAVAGTHGKTSTVGLLAHMALPSLDPTILIGGYLNTIKSHAYVGKSAYWITEADESDASFLLLRPDIAIITNIDEDHMETYQNDFDKLLKAYHDFLKPVSDTKTRNWAVLCYDDPVLQKHYINHTKRAVITYGLHPKAMIRAMNVRQNGQTLGFTIVRNAVNAGPLNINIHLSGHHNVLNLLAAVAVGTILNISDEMIKSTFKNYPGIARRFQILGEVSYQEKKICIIDDYGHHPREITATLQAIKSMWPTRRLIMVFQPHRYTRTRDLLEAFAKTLASQAKDLILLPIYAASESELEGISSTFLAEKIKQYTHDRAIVAQDQATLFSALSNKIQGDDIVLFQGAGDITKMAHAFLDNFCVASLTT